MSTQSTEHFVSLITDIFRAIFGGDSASKPKPGAKPRREKPQNRPALPSLVGKAVVGTVTNGLPSSLQLRTARGAKISVTLNAGERSAIDGDVPAAGSEVEVLVTRSRTASADSWQGSFAALREAKIREALAEVQPGTVAAGVVSATSDDWVRVDCGGFEVRVPHSELSWWWFDGIEEVVKLGDPVHVRVDSVYLPDDWLEQPDRHAAHATGSLRSAAEDPDADTVVMGFSALRCSLVARARLPRDCDAMVVHVLECLADEDAPTRLAELGLPDASLQAIRAHLRSLGFVRKESLTGAGRRAVQAVALQRAVAAEPVRFLFMSAAQAGRRAVPVDEAASYSTSKGFPPPIRDPGVERRIIRTADGAISDELIRDLTEGAEARQLTVARDNPSMSLFVQRTRGGHARVALEVSRRWVLAGLWRNFEPIDPDVRRPSDEAVGATNLLLCEAEFIVPDPDEEPGMDDEPSTCERRTVFFEPSTSTYWTVGHATPRLIPVPRANSFPALPPIPRHRDGSTSGPLEPDAVRWVIAAWTSP